MQKEFFRFENLWADPGCVVLCPHSSKEAPDVCDQAALPPHLIMLRNIIYL